MTGGPSPKRVRSGGRDQQGPAGQEVGWLARLHRGADLFLGAGLCLFGALGFAHRLSFFSTAGAPVLGLSTNGLLSTLSLVFGAVLIAAGIRGGRTASTTGVVVGALFMASGVVNVVLLTTPYNLLSFRMPNVVFSLVAGALLLILGAYGRFTGRLPDDNPYRSRRIDGPVDAQHGPDNDQQLPTDPADAAAARDLAAAERRAAAMPHSEHQAVPDDVRDARESADRRAIWRRRRGDRGPDRPVTARPRSAPSWRGSPGRRG